MYECFHCGFRSVIWNGDFDFEDYGYEGEGIIHTLTCQHCGAEIEYAIAANNNNCVGQMSLFEEEEDESNSERTEQEE